MIKKIVGWTVFTVFVGLIIYGAIIRTNSKLTDASPQRETRQGQNEGDGRGQGGKESEEVDAEFDSEESEELEAPVSTVDILINTASGEELEIFVGDSEHEWVTYTGTVASVTNKILTVTLADGQSLLIERRPWRFAQEKGFTTAVGNQIEIIGFYENSVFQAAQLHDLTTDLIVRLRDETGHPLWASE